MVAFVATLAVPYDRAEVTPQRPGVWALVTLALVVATVAAGIVCKNVADIVGVLGGTLSTIVVRARTAGASAKRVATAGTPGCR